MAWKSGLKMPLLPIGPSSPLQTILLSDLFRCDSPLQIVKAVWHTFFYNFKPAKQPYCQQRAVTPDPGSSNFKKVCQPAITICWGLSHLPGWAALHFENISRSFFQGWRNPLKDINSRVFLKNKKGLNLATENICGLLERSSVHYFFWVGSWSSLGRYVFGSEISYNKAPPRLPGLGC